VVVRFAESVGSRGGSVCTQHWTYQVLAGFGYPALRLHRMAHDVAHTGLALCAVRVGKQAGVQRAWGGSDRHRDRVFAKIDVSAQFAGMLRPILTGHYPKLNGWSSSTSQTGTTLNPRQSDSSGRKRGVEGRAGLRRRCLCDHWVP
jgi:hypothetical protein